MVPQPLLAQDQLAGVYEKLKRADESIRSLNSEIVAFLKERPDGGFSGEKQKASKEFVEFHSKREIPLRFGVIAGEIVHHLRSSLDHIAWLLSSGQYRQSSGTQIALPILVSKPGKKSEVASYKGRIEGIKSKEARSLIEKLQPYNAPDPLDDPIAIILEFDRIDKHRTLMLVENQWQMGLTIPLRFFTWTITGLDIDQELLTPTPADQLKLEFSMSVAFPQFGKRKNQPVIPGLTELANNLRVVAGRFSELSA